MTCTMFVNMRQAHVIQKCFGTCKRAAANQTPGECPGGGGA